MEHVEMLEAKAAELRRTIVEMIHRAGSGHTGGSLSAVELVTALYYSEMKIDPQHPQDDDRDRFVLSKGHAAPLLYAVLADQGFFPREELSTLRRFGSRLQGHPCREKLPGVELSTGSLGMGISAGIGMALAARQKGASWRTYVLCGDGEMNEGQNWEGFMAANKWKLDQLVIIIDRNRVQLDGTESEIMPTGDLAAKIATFGLRTREIDGHSIPQILEALEWARQSGQGASVIVANTVKGKGVSFMEGKNIWHGKQIGDADYAAAMQELEGGNAHA